MGFVSVKIIEEFLQTMREYKSSPIEYFLVIFEPSIYCWISSSLYKYDVSSQLVRHCIVQFLLLRDCDVVLSNMYWILSTFCLRSMNFFFQHSNYDLVFIMVGST